MQRSVYKDKIEKKDRGNLRVAVVVAMFNREVTEGLEQGAHQALRNGGVADENIKTYQVAGSFEVAQLVSALAKTKRFGAILALGSIIKGETTHDQYLADAVTQGLLRTGQETGVAIGLGIITALNLEQAMARSATNDLNRGYHAAKAALELVDQLQTL